MKTRAEFTVHIATEFGLGVDKRKCHLGDTPEDTFMNAWRSLPKRYDKNWVSITWEQGDKEFKIDRQLFRDNRFHFDITVEETC